MKTQIQAGLIAVLFALTFGCSSPYSAAQVSDLGPPAVSEPPEANLLRFCLEEIAPVIKNITALADQTAPEIERLERSERFTPGFITETSGSCATDAARLADSFSSCDLWALSRNFDAVLTLHGEARGVEVMCSAILKTLRNN